MPSSEDTKVACPGHAGRVSLLGETPLRLVRQGVRQTRQCHRKQQLHNAGFEPSSQNNLLVAVAAEDLGRLILAVGSKGEDLCVFSSVRAKFVLRGALMMLNFGRTADGLTGNGVIEKAFCYLSLHLISVSGGFDAKFQDILRSSRSGSD